MYSLDGKDWNAVVDSNFTIEIFEGSWNRITPAIHLFHEEVIAKYIRIQPLTWFGDITLRLELLGCPGEKLPCVDPLGIEAGNITDSQITASSKLNNDTSAKSARLNHKPDVESSESQGAWVAEFDDLNQWIQAGLLRQIPITGVIVQGNPSTDKWVSRFQVQHSLNIVDWFFVEDSDGNEKVFPGSVDRDTPIVNTFQEPITAQYIRVVPIEWHGNISMRFELLGCQTPTLPCIDPFGMESGLIIDDQITTSTASSDTSSAIYARYNQLPEVNGTSGAWIAGVSDSNQWLQINLFRQMMVTGVNMQGNPSADWWVKRYKVEISLDHTIWEYVHDEYSEIEVFEGSYDRDVNITHLFYEPVKAHYVRIRPVEWHGQISMRVELLGCPGILIPCQDKLGVEDGNITDDQLQASSDLSNGTGLLQWRLNQEAVTDIPGAWVALTSDTQPWLQINLYRHTHIAGVIVQGRADADQWVTSYKVQTSLDGTTLVYVNDKDGVQELFEGSWDQSTPVTHLFHEAVLAQYVRILPQSWHGNVSMRCELLGCQIPVLPCYDALGMENGNISDTDISSSTTNGGYLPELARLHTASAWRSYYNNAQQWIQVQFLRQLPITGIITQGEKGANVWVTRFKVQYSLDYQTWNFVLDETGEEELFEANWDDSSPATNYFFSPVFVHYIRIKPTLWITTIALRFELLGCLHEPLPCQDLLGMEDGIITDQQFFASANLSDYGVSFARLNGPKAWAGQYNNLTQWFQVNFRTPVLVTGIIMQGRQDADAWVSRYRVMTSLDDVIWENVTDEDGLMEVCQLGLSPIMCIYNVYMCIYGKHFRSGIY
ncbi:uncharacterized protein [Amphiura filiformis]|uniref:uncharacterized protein n=1 Tax=Amphiura filiformis TaxID=82378 RepID=UPI003B2186E2